MKVSQGVIATTADDHSQYLDVNYMVLSFFFQYTNATSNQIHSSNFLLTFGVVDDAFGVSDCCEVCGVSGGPGSYWLAGVGYKLAGTLNVLLHIPCST